MQGGIFFTTLSTDRAILRNNESELLDKRTNASQRMACGSFEPTGSSIEARQVFGDSIPNFQRHSFNIEACYLG
jgi:hypothetical protein